jgi:hydrophobic/amphiphilic exporter-1 (mainly G- bacteria), HAE1 family
VTIAISVLLSAFNALTLSPALSAMLLKPRKEARGPLGAFFRWFNRVFGRATDGYVHWSGVLIRKSARAMLLLVGLVVLTGLVGSRLPSGFLPEEDQGYLYLAVQLPNAASLQRTDAVCRQIEQILAETPACTATTRSSASACSRPSTPPTTPSSS